MYTVMAYSLAKEGSREVETHFKVKEFACKDGSDLILISPGLIEVLHRIRQKFKTPVIITSAYRTAAYNKTVRGAPKSTHLVGLAADIVVKGVTPAKVASYADTLLQESGGIGQYSNFVHIDVRHEKARWHG